MKKLSALSSLFLGIGVSTLLTAAPFGIAPAVLGAEQLPVPSTPVWVSGDGPGPVSTLYWTRWDRNLLASMQGQTVNGVNSVRPRPATIAVVADEIHTAGLGGIMGARYALDGSYLGDLAGNGLDLGDGTTDGTFNYAFRNTGGSNALYRFDLNWQNPTVYIPYASLGNGGIFGLAGLTYDPTDDTFWAIDYGGPGAIRHLARNGTLLGQFPVGSWSTFLAMDHADRTLWTYGASGLTNELQQYDTNGTLLQTVVFNEHLGITAAEFGPPPEPDDTDGDGVPDDEDAFPNDPAESVDSDGDGVGNNADAFPSDPAESTDSDGDGVGDNGDAFPNDPAESVDSDGDGVGDNADAFPSDPAESTDSDGDGVGDNGDAFPNDPAESVDSDGDGVGDNADTVPHSNMEANVRVGTCVAPVANQPLLNGATFNDLIAAAVGGAANHGAAVKAVTQLANEWKKAGLIPGSALGAIASCGGKR